MVTIITGDKNAGKTAYLEDWYKQDKKGTGFFCRKAFVGNEFQGYDLVLLPGEETVPFIRLPEYMGDEAVFRPPFVRWKRFLFSGAVFAQAQDWIGQHACPDEPVWIDEVGGLELLGGGFDPLLHHLFATYTDIRIVFRQQLLDELIPHYGITEKKILFI